MFQNHLRFQINYGKAVSYTHLDVYKRQPVENAVIKGVVQQLQDGKKPGTTVVEMCIRDSKRARRGATSDDHGKPYLSSSSLR